MTPYPTAIERFPTLRQSLLAAFDRCALAARFDFEHRKGWTGHPQARGQIFHRWAAKVLQEMHDQNERTIPTDLAESILNEVLRQDDVDRECIEPGCGAAIVSRRDDGRVVCARGHDHSADFVNLPADEEKDLRWVVVKFAHDNAFDIENLVDIEHPLRAPITYPDPEGGTVERILTGTLDALFVAGEEDEEAIVLDWKDTWDLPAPTEVGFDGYFQQRFYAWLVMRNYRQIERVTLKEFYVRYSEPREATVERAAIENVEASLSALVERFDRCIEESIYPPSPGRHCQICARPTACPIFPGVKTGGTITDQETAERYAAEATVAKKAYDHRRAELAAWGSVHGHTELSSHKGRRVWGHREYKRTKRPSRDEMEAALKANGVSAVDLDDLYVTRKGTRFEQFQPDPEDDGVPDESGLEDALAASIEQAGNVRSDD